MKLDYCGYEKSSNFFYDLEPKEGLFRGEIFIIFSCGLEYSLNKQVQI